MTALPLNGARYEVAGELQSERYYSRRGEICGPIRPYQQASASERSAMPSTDRKNIVLGKCCSL